jgi:hypothetical protein
MKTTVILILGGFLLATAVWMPSVLKPLSTSKIVPAAVAPTEPQEPIEAVETPGMPSEQVAEGPSEDSNVSETPINETAALKEPTVAAIDAAQEAARTRRIQAITSRYSVGLIDIVRLVQGGVDREVVMAYVNNSRVPFAPTSREVLQLRNAGVPSEVITAIINRGNELRQEYAQAVKERQEWLVQQQLAARARATQSYGTGPNNGLSGETTVAAAQNYSYNSGLGSGFNNRNYTVYPTYPYAVVPRGIAPSQPVPVTMPKGLPSYPPAVPPSTFQYANKFRYALPNSSYRSPEGYTAPKPAIPGGR